MVVSSKTANNITTAPIKNHNNDVGGFKAVFGCTYEALALYRISLGILLVCELVFRFSFLHPFYSDEGTLPLRLLLPKVDTLYKAVCLHCQFGELWQQQILLCIQISVGILFTVGYQTKLTSILSWYLYFSSTLRNTWLSFILDRYFHFLLFYSMFLPLNNSYTISTLLHSNKNKNTQQNQQQLVLSPATIALKLLVFWIYLDAGGGKYLDPLEGWTLNAKPLPALDTYTRHTITARYLYAILGPTGLRYLTPTVVYVELFAAPLAFFGCYIANATIVNISIILICSLHIGIALCMRNAVLLSLVACSAWCVFLPVGWGNVDYSSSNDNGINTDSNNNDTELSSSDSSRTITAKTTNIFSTIVILLMITGNIWFGTLSTECEQSVKHIWSSLLHNRWNVFVGAEEYVTWEIAPGLLADESVVDVWGRRDYVDWTLPGTGAPCTSTSRPGRWRSFPYLAGLEGDDAIALWSYLCYQWDYENDVVNNPGRKLLKYNFFMLQADVLPNMGFSATRKRLIQSFDCDTATTSSGSTNVTAAVMSQANKEDNNEAAISNSISADGNQPRQQENDEENYSSEKPSASDNDRSNTTFAASTSTDEL